MSPRIVLKNLTTFLLAVLFFYGLYCGYEFVFNMPMDKTYCGTVVAKIPTIHEGKYSITNKFIMVVDFDVVGRRDMQTTATTYVSKEVGDRVCFSLRLAEETDFIKVIFFCKMVLAIISWFVFVLWGLYQIIAYFFWLYGEKKTK